MFDARVWREGSARTHVVRNADAPDEEGSDQEGFDQDMKSDVLVAAYRAECDKTPVGGHRVRRNDPRRAAINELGHRGDHTDEPLHGFLFVA